MISEFEYKQLSCLSGLYSINSLQHFISFILKRQVSVQEIYELIERINKEGEKNV